MRRRSLFRNPTGPANGGDPVSAPSVPMDKQVKEYGDMLKTGAAVIGGQIGASVATNMALDVAKVPPDSKMRKVLSTGVPIALGIAAMAATKDKTIQAVALGSITAGVGAGVRAVWPQVKFTPVGDGDVLMWEPPAGYLAAPDLDAGTLALHYAELADAYADIVDGDELDDYEDLADDYDLADYEDLADDYDLADVAGDELDDDELADDELADVGDVADELAYY